MPIGFATEPGPNCLRFARPQRQQIAYLGARPAPLFPVAYAHPAAQPLVQLGDPAIATAFIDDQTGLDGGCTLKMNQPLGDNHRMPRTLRLQRRMLLLALSPGIEAIAQPLPFMDESGILRGREWRGDGVGLYAHWTQADAARHATLRGLACTRDVAAETLPRLGGEP